MLLFLVFVASLLVQGAAFPALTWRRSRCAAAASSWLSMSVGVLKGPSYAVSDLERSIAFYSKVLGFKVAEDNRAQGVARVVLDDGDAAAMTVELLQQQPSSSGVTMGDAYAGIGVRVPSATQIFQSAAAQGGRVLLEVGDFAYAASLFPDEDEMRNTPVRYGRLADPDGYLVEVREDAKLAPAAKRLFKMRMNVLDIEESVAFYRDVAGMTVLRRRSNVYSVPKDASMCAYLGYADEAAGPYLELHYNYATDKLDMGNGFRRAVLQVPNKDEAVRKAREGKAVEVAADGADVVRDPSDFPVVFMH